MKRDEELRLKQAEADLAEMRIFQERERLLRKQKEELERAKRIKQREAAKARQVL